MLFDNDSDDAGVLDNEQDIANGDQSGDSPKPYEIPDDAYVSVKVDGEDKMLPWKEARSGVMFQSTFTKKTQELAREREKWGSERKELETSHSSQLNQMRELLSNPQTIAALYMHAMSRQAQPTAPQPLTTDAIPNIQKSLEERLNEGLGRVKSELSQARTAERNEAELETHMQGLLANAPFLSAVEGVSEVVYGKVYAAKPQSLDEAKALVKQTVESMNANAEKRYADQRKQAEVRKARALTNGAEPKGGGPVFNRPPTVKKLEDLDGAFLQYLQQADRSDA